MGPVDAQTPTEKNSSSMAPAEENKVENRGAHLRKENRDDPNYVCLNGEKPKKAVKKVENRGAHLRKENRENPNFVTVNGKKPNKA